jgi:hypothetical protein
MASKVIMGMTIEENPSLGTEPGLRHRTLARYQLSYHWRRDDVFFDESHEVTVKKVENNTVYYKETVVYRHPIFFGKEVGGRGVHCHIAKPDPNRRVCTDRVPLWVPLGLYSPSEEEFQVVAMFLVSAGFIHSLSILRNSQAGTHE